MSTMEMVLVFEINALTDSLHKYWHVNDRLSVLRIKPMTKLKIQSFEKLPIM